MFKEYNVSMVVDVPDIGASRDEIEEWIEFKAGYAGSIDADNPLIDTNMNANWIEVEPH